MSARRLEDGQPVSLRRHVANGIVDKDGVERLAEPDGPHVANVVGNAGVQPARVGKHRFRQADCGRVELADKLMEVVAASGAQVKDASLARSESLPEFAQPVEGLFLSSSQEDSSQRPQVSEVAVESVVSVRTPMGPYLHKKRNAALSRRFPMLATMVDAPAPGKSRIILKY